MFHIGSLGRSQAIDLNVELLSTAAQGRENECAFLTLKQKLFALLEENGGSILLLTTTPACVGRIGSPRSTDMNTKRLSSRRMRDRATTIVNKECESCLPSVQLRLLIGVASDCDYGRRIDR